MGKRTEEDAAHSAGGGSSSLSHSTEGPPPTTIIPPTGQSRKWSMTEAVVSTFVGYAVAWVVLAALVRMTGVPMSGGQQHTFIAVMTVVSVLRGYAVRRFFNWFHETKKT